MLEVKKENERLTKANREREAKEREELAARAQSNESQGETSIWDRLTKSSKSHRGG